MKVITHENELTKHKVQKGFSRLLAAACAVLMHSLVMASSDDPAVSGGAAEPTLYQDSGLDSINLFNGALNIQIPLGPQYQVDGGYTYGFSLYYSTSVWSKIQINCPDPDPKIPRDLIIPKYERGGIRVGLGWYLRPALTLVNLPGTLLYPSIVMADTSWHTFNKASPEGNVWLSYNGSFMRLTSIEPPTKWKVEFPDGSTALFETPPDDLTWARVVSIQDSFGQEVLTYDYDTPGQIRVTDLEGRTHAMHVTYLNGVSDRVQASKLVLKAFDGTNAEYVFTTQPETIHRMDSINLAQYECEEEEYIEEPLLKSISLPDGSIYRIETYLDDNELPQSGEVIGNEASGHIRSMMLPTGGKHEWRYSDKLPGQSVIAPKRVASKQEFETPPDPGPPATPGVLSAIWKYAQVNLPVIPGIPAGHKVIVSDPVGNESVHYFHSGGVTQYEGNGDWRSHWFEGLPFHSEHHIQSSRGEHNLYLSSEVYEGTVTTGTKLRSMYVRYEVDDPTQVPQLGEAVNQHPRQQAEAIVYHDDSSYTLETLNSDYDGFGHYRRNERWAVGATSRVLKATTRYNDHLGTVTAEQRFTLEPWLFTTSEFSEVELSEQRSRTETCYDLETGFLLRQRALRNFGTGRSANDVVTVFAPEIVDGQATGNVSSKSIYGADVTPLTGGAVTEDLCSNPFATALAEVTPGFREKYTYQYGVLKTAEVVSPTTGDAVLLTTDNSINPNTGFVAISRDPAGVATTYNYDDMGRVTSVARPGSPTVTNSYCLRSIASCGGENAVLQLEAAGAINVSDRFYVFDGLARKIESQVKSAKSETDTETIKTLFKYDGLGRLTTQSVAEVAPSLTGARVTDFGYDALGRQSYVQLPDGSLTSYDYEGVRSKSIMYTTYNGMKEVPFEKTVNSDPIINVETGVTEPSGVGNGAVTTNYSYDVNGRLTQVQSGVQTRSFGYDSAGWLHSATFPEISETTQHQQFDVFGNPRSTSIGSRTITSNYDEAGRLILQSEVVEEAERPLFEFYYAQDNLGSDNRAGKLTRVKRHNYILIDPSNPATSPAHHFAVTERYKYRQASGLLTDLDSSVVSFDDNLIDHAQPDLLFEKSYAYDLAGQLQTIGYPSAEKVGGTRPAQSLEYQYNYGFQVTASTPASQLVSVEYSRGATSRLAYDNGIEQTIVLDSSGILRTGEVALSLNDTPVWETGVYGYDGSGNIKAIGDDRFEYDGVGRLRTGLVGGLVQSASYDQYGNITSLVTGGESAPIQVNSSTNRLQNVAGVNFTYDTFGNITNWNDKRISYDVANMVTNSDFGDSVRSYVYGPDNRRIGVVDEGSGDVFWTVRGSSGQVLSEFRTAAAGIKWERDYFYLGGGLLAASHPAGVSTEARFFHVDHLSSTRVVTDEAGAVVAEYDFFPFGGFAYESGSEAEFETHLFTGHERDRNDEPGAADDLDYMLARYYTSFLGRFLSVDPLIGTAGEPQSWNRYAYARNKPINQVDPDGQSPNESTQMIDSSCPNNLCHSSSTSYQSPGSNQQSNSEGSHAALGLLGMVPGLGMVADAVDAAIYAVEGNLAEATLSVFAMLPVAGEIAAGARLANKGGRVVAGAMDVTRLGSRSAPYKRVYGHLEDVGGISPLNTHSVPFDKYRPEINFQQVREDADAVLQGYGQIALRGTPSPRRTYEEEVQVIIDTIKDFGK